MTITGTKSFTSEVLTSSDVNRYLMRGVKVYADSSARDAAYGGAGEPTLEEGEVCYLTGTDKVQVYGGTAAGWLEVGPKTFPVTAISSAQVTTAQSTSSTSYTDLSTVGPSVTLTTGTSAIVLFGGRYDDDGNLGNDGYISYAVSGATTVAASDTFSCYGIQAYGGEMNVPLNYQHLVTGLTAGSNTFTLKYKKSGGTSTAGFSYRFITVIAL